MNPISVLGASGRTGRLFVELALKDGYKVKALVRTPSKLELQHPSLEVIQGDVSDPVKVAETIKATDAVIDLINPGKGSPPDLLQIATQNILNAMQQNNVKRLVCWPAFRSGLRTSATNQVFITSLRCSCRTPCWGRWSRRGGHAWI